MGDFYRDVVKWFFGDRELLPAHMFETTSFFEGDDEINDEELAKLPEGMQRLLKRQQEQRNYRIKTSKDRSGISVVKL